MAKGNLFLGTARKKVGDVVLYRRNGSQQARVRVRTIKNPKTQAQMIQRAIAATITKAYSQGKVLFDHSFEGKAVGMASMNYFRKVNMRALRAAIVADVNGATAVENQRAAVVAPSAVCATAWPYKVSEGTLVQSLFVPVFDEDSYPGLAIQLSAAEQAMTIPAFLASRGISEGDIFTALGFGLITNDGAFTSQFGVFASQPETNFGFVRLTVKDTSALQTAMSAAKFSDIFEVSGTQPFNADALVTVPVACIDITGQDSGFIGCIRSRENDRKRSSCVLFTGQNGGESAVPFTGIKSSYLLNAWGSSVDQLGQSDLILEGGSF